MFDKINFFQNLPFSKKIINSNIIKVKKVFNELRIDIENSEIPLIETFKKDYNYDFSQTLVKKFSRYKKIFIIGMGGSILGSKSLYSFFKEKIKKEVFFFDNLDENLITNFNKIKNKNKSCFIIISKSGSTLETLANFLTITKKKIDKNKLIFITENRDNALLEIASKYNAEIIEHKEFVGGRYSVLSEVGMLPAILMGLHVDKFKNFTKLIKNKKFISCLMYDVACIYTLNNKNVTNSIFLTYDSKLYDLCYWYQQLAGESLGKQKKGIMPIVSVAPKDNHSLLQLYLDGPRDKFFTFFSSKNAIKSYKFSVKNIPKTMGYIKNRTLKEIINSQLTATKNVFKSKKIPFREFNFIKNNEQEFGDIIIFLMLETILLARMMKIDPFNQPAVEQVKLETKKILSN